MIMLLAMISAQFWVSNGLRFCRRAMVFPRNFMRFPNLAYSSTSVLAARWPLPSKEVEIIESSVSAELMSTLHKTISAAAPPEETVLHYKSPAEMLASLLPGDEVRHIYQPSECSQKDPLSNSILELWEFPDKPRTIWAMSAGPGRGKSRRLFELATELNTHPHVLAVAISFKQSTEIAVKDKWTLGRLENKYGNCMFSVVARLWSVATGVGFDRVSASMWTTLQRAEKQYGVRELSSVRSAIASRLLRTIIIELVEYHRKNTANKQGISTFSLLVDDMDRALTEYGVDKFTDMLSHAIVSGGEDKSVIIPEVGDPIKGCLVLSADSPKAIGAYRGYGRQIFTAASPLTLDAHRIVDEWLPAYAPQWHNVYKDDPTTASKIEVLMSTLVQLPGAVQEAVRAFKTMDKSMFASDRIREEVFDKVARAVDCKYPQFRDAEFPVNVAYAALKGGELYVPPSDVVMDMTQKSILTNYIDSFWTHVFLTEKFAIKPSVGVHNLWSFAENVHKDSTNKYLAPVRRMMDGVLRHLEDGNTRAAIGVVVRQIINLRLSVMAAQTSETCRWSFDDLLYENPISYSSYCIHDYLGGMDSEIAPGDPSQVMLIESSSVELLPSSAKGSAAAMKNFIQAANDIVLSSVVREVPLAHNENADGGWMFWNSNKNPHVLLIDAATAVPANSIVVSERNATKTDAECQITNDWARARHWHEVAAKAKKMAESGDLVLRKGSLAEALANDRYWFVYLSAGHNAPSMVRLKGKSENGDPIDREWHGTFVALKAMNGLMKPFDQLHGALCRLCTAQLQSGNLPQQK